MTDEARPLERDQVVEALVEHYAQDRLEIGEFERRVEQAHQSRTRDELRALLADLPSLAGPTAVTRPGGASGSGMGQTLAPGGSEAGWPVVPGTAIRINQGRVAERQTEVAIWSGRVRKGAWHPARLIRALGFMGGVELDFREALFPPGETRVFAGALMGGVDILVPPGVRVETEGFAFMGGFEEDTAGDADISPPPNAPVLRVSGFALMGGVNISSRLPGESPRDARRRRKEAMRRLRSGDDR